MVDLLFGIDMCVEVLYSVFCSGVRWGAEHKDRVWVFPVWSTLQY